MIRLALYPTAESGQDAIDINLKVFGLPETRELLAHLGLNTSHARSLRAKVD